MASIPANGQHAVVGQTVELHVTSGATNAEGDQFEQLYSHTFRGGHGENTSPFGVREHYAYGRGGMMFDFSCWASDTLLERLRTAYNFTTGDSGTLPLRYYHLKYTTIQGGATYKYVNFSGRIKDLTWSRQGSMETLTPVACSVRLQDANYTSLGQLPDFDAAAYNTTGSLAM